MRNFRQPYFALSIREFWQRWHISLSTWFRDYVYFPLAARLGGSSILGVHVSFVTLFILSGLWHGANWTFVIWGGLHGLYLVCEYTIQRWTLWAQPSAEWVPLVWSNKYVACMFRAALTFSLVCVSWVFFRANSLQDAWYILRHFLTFPAGSWTVLTKPLGAADSEFGRGIAAILLVNVIDGIDARYGWIDFLGSRPPIVRWAIYYGLTAGIVLIGIWGTQEFIYFKF